MPSSQQVDSWEDIDAESEAHGVERGEQVFLKPAARAKTAQEIEDDWHMQSILGVEEMLAQKSPVTTAGLATSSRDQDRNGTAQYRSQERDTNWNGRQQLRTSGADSRGKGNARRQVRSEEGSLFVSNLSEEASETDLRELFGGCGRLQRVHILKDRYTSRSKGSAFVSFYAQQDAQRAIDKLNGHGYDNLRLKVQWANQKS
eukprot:TRINITY_DN72713_c0_g1_i1.p1 TRINITY_DN72713_c0_g1~~TRINITY_DN72713_c0_g1_i1.p1  ORF type:complete len:202 (+),score=24.59 TRINITY_DN72713_c0_g1_i1:40-645(+)